MITGSAFPRDLQNLSANLQKVIDMHNEDFIVEHKPSTILIQCMCNKTHRLVHRGDETIFFCGGKEVAYPMPKRKIVSITPDATPEVSPMSTPERKPAAYVIPQRRDFKPVKLTFTDENTGMYQ